MPKNEWENADLDFFRAFYNVIKKLAQLFFQTLLTSLFKQRYIVLLQVTNILTS